MRTLKKIQIGTILDNEAETKAIYNDFQEYFKVDKEYGWLIRYIIVKEPSRELTGVIEAYYSKVKERNRERDEFVERVAKEVYASLSEKDKDYIFDHPDSTTNHFGMGLWIRNEYIHGKELKFEYGHDADRLSSQITAKIASLVIGNYDYENPFYRRLYEDFRFNHIRCLYYAIMGEYPDAIMDKYADMPDDEAAAEIVYGKVKETVLSLDRFRSLSTRYGISDKQYEQYKKFVDTYNPQHGDIIPYDIAVLCSKTLEQEERQRWLRVLKAVLKEAPRLALDMPLFIFNQKDTVLVAVTEFGCSLKRFKKFSSDGDVIKAALTDNGEAIQYVHKSVRYKAEYLKLALSNEHSNALKMRCMIPYRDEDKWVKIALAVNGRNIEWASARIKDDFEMAAFAIRHQGNWYPDSTVCNLSARLRDDIEIALLDIREGHASVCSYSRRLRNNDEVAKALLETEHKWKIYNMSKRIQMKYGHDE